MIKLKRKLSLRVELRKRSSQKWRESRATIPPAELNKMIEVELKRLAAKNESEASEAVN
ncbi:MAG: hypothetical protein ABI698_10655 [bacterium]